MAYDPLWADQFEQLKRWYVEMLVGLPLLDVEHVGSTSVPGLAAKPIIDVDVVVHRDEVSHAILAFEKHGHMCRGDLGITDRYAFEIANPPFATNTYVIVEGSVALKNHLTLRRVLRESPELRQEYSVIKRQLAWNLEDPHAYSTAKSGIIQKILKYGGMDDDSLFLIEKENR